LGYQSTGIGDFNNDGIGDYAFSSLGDYVYVIYGTASLVNTPIDLGNLSIS
jgi:hypothetical protein